MLKKIRIQILVESVLKLNITLLPIDFIAERYARSLYKLHFVLTGQVNVYYLFTVVSDIKLFMRPNIIRIRHRDSIIVFQFSYNTYKRRFS